MKVITALHRSMPVALLLSSFLALALPGAEDSKNVLNPEWAAVFELRATLTKALLQGEEKPSEALDRLRETNFAVHLAPDPEADFALAAIDIGHRLLGAERPDLAEAFFRAGEASLDQLVHDSQKRTPDQDQAHYLQMLAHVRANFLNKVAQARSDIDAAIKLQPENKQLQESRKLLARGHAQFFAETKETK